MTLVEIESREGGDWLVVERRQGTLGLMSRVLATEEKAIEAARTIACEATSARIKILDRKGFLLAEHDYADGARTRSLTFRALDAS